MGERRWILNKGNQKRHRKCTLSFSILQWSSNFLKIYIYREREGGRKIIYILQKFTLHSIQFYDFDKNKEV